MRPCELIERATNKGKKALNEAESKAMLACYEVPVINEIVCSTTDEAAHNAEIMGFPVVLKGFGNELAHKTELGLVQIGLSNGEAVREAAREMIALGQVDLEGWLVQPQLRGRREFVAGMFRDDQFGPVIMFGLGGIFTEALNDVVFRIAPLDDRQADQMLNEIASGDLLGPFRGESAVDRGQLSKILVGLSRLGMEFPSISEVDINPLLITAEGEPVAVDALVTLGESERKDLVRPPVESAAVSSIFHPRSVAFVGATRAFRKWGQMIFTNVIDGGFEGRIHLVNPHNDTIGGRKVYRSVCDIPETVDLAVVTIPASRILSLIPEFREKGIRAMVVISSGFGEMGAGGQELETRLIEEAQNNGILIFGPNTMGMCNPHEKFYCMSASARPKPGNTVFISQSGNLGAQVLAFAEAQGIGIRAFAGSGNEAMLTIEDALEYFGEDDLTRVILLYLESVKHGSRFLGLATRVSRKKPIILLKGGRTRAGRRAAASHTGALASDNRVFEAACRQAGIITVRRTMDLLDLCAALSSVPLPKGRRVAIMTLGGGWGVVTADLCNENGLELPEPTSELIKRLDPFLPSYWSRSNPFDLVGESDPDLVFRVMDELIRWDGCDAVIGLGVTERASALERLIVSTTRVIPEMDESHLRLNKRRVMEFDAAYLDRSSRLMEKYQKPILNVSRAASINEQSVSGVSGGRYAGVTFKTPERAVKALAKMCAYKDWLIFEKASEYHSVLDESVSM